MSKSRPSQIWNSKLRHGVQRVLSVVGAVLLALAPWQFMFPTAAQSSSPTRRVNIPYVSSPVTWSQTAIFWLGKNDWWEMVPGRNYADVRVAYSAAALHVRVTVVDYYLWNNEPQNGAGDLTQYDAAAIYLDTGFDRSPMPQLDDYYFLAGSRNYPPDNAPQYHRQARGTGSGWNTGWVGNWTDQHGLQWSCNPGPNANSACLDYGWNAIFNIPWETLGFSGPPAAGTLWGLGVLLYDRDDQPPAGVATEYWPETFNASSPATWGELHFGYASYKPLPAVPQGTTSIRAASPQDNTVEDAWMGGGGTCDGGHNGGSEINHGSDGGLFIGTEDSPTHFPCFNKSYLRFSLAGIPPGKTIISATLTLHLWGNAGDIGQAQPSWVHLFTVTDPWQEMTIHWNNAPLARENVSATWVYPYSRPGNVQWPGDPYAWDATQAVAEAYAEGRPVSMALYGSDTAQHSSKYLTGSEVEDWDAVGRPTLTVVWGQPQPVVNKQVSQLCPTHGSVITYTLSVLGTSQPLTVTDTLPNGLSAPGSISASSGSASYNSAMRQVTWTGTPTTGQAVTITFPVTIQVPGPLALSNIATLAAADGYVSNTEVRIFVDGYCLYLPAALKNSNQ